MSLIHLEIPVFVPCGNTYSSKYIFTINNSLYDENIKKSPKVWKRKVKDCDWPLSSPSLAKQFHRKKS